MAHTVLRGQMSLDNSSANEQKMGSYRAGQLDAKSEQGADVPPASSEYSGKLVKRWHLVLAHVPILSCKTNPGTQHMSCHLPFFFQRKREKILHICETSAFKATIAGNVDVCALQKINARAYFHRMLCALPSLDQGVLRPQSHGLRQKHCIDWRYLPH